jgi:hypothetical protein
MDYYGWLEVGTMLFVLLIGLIVSLIGLAVTLVGIVLDPGSQLEQGEARVPLLCALAGEEQRKRLRTILANRKAEADAAPKPTRGYAARHAAVPAEKTLVREAGDIGRQMDELADKLTRDQIMIEVWSFHLLTRRWF